MKVSLKRYFFIEVKAGSTGGLKSLDQFMAERTLPRAVRINSEPPGIVDVNVKTTTGIPSKYKLVWLPFYLTSKI